MVQGSPEAANYKTYRLAAGFIPARTKKRQKSERHALYRRALF